jgi:hypothetical protein
MIHYAGQVGVARQARDIFAAVNDIARWPEWTDMRDVQPDSPGQIHVGSAGSFTLSKGPFKGPIRYEATTVEPDRRVVYRMTHPAFMWEAEMAVERHDLGARLSTTGSFRLRGWRRLLEPLVGGEIRRGELAELHRLKAILEAGTAPVGARGAAADESATLEGGT